MKSELIKLLEEFLKECDREQESRVDFARKHEGMIATTVQRNLDEFLEYLKANL